MVNKCPNCNEGNLGSWNSFSDETTIFSCPECGYQLEFMDVPIQEMAIQNIENNIDRIIEAFTAEDEHISSNNEADELLSDKIKEYFENHPMIDFYDVIDEQVFESSGYDTGIISYVYTCYISESSEFLVNHDVIQWERM